MVLVPEDGKWGPDDLQEMLGALYFVGVEVLLYIVLVYEIDHCTALGLCSTCQRFVRFGNCVCIC